MYNLSLQKVGGGCGVSGGWAEFSSWTEKSRNQALSVLCAFPQEENGSASMNLLHLDICHWLICACFQV